MSPAFLLHNGLLRLLRWENLGISELQRVGRLQPMQAPFVAAGSPLLQPCRASNKPFLLRRPLPTSGSRG